MISAALVALMRAYKLLPVGVALSTCLFVGVESALAQDQGIRLQFENGTVTLVARDVTIGAILEQWSQIGSTTVLNRGALPTTPLSVELNRVSEPAALETILRGLPGYVLMDRVSPAPGRSQIDRIVLLGSSTAPAPARSFEPLLSTPPSIAPARPSTRARANLLPEPDEISTNGIVNVAPNSDSEPAQVGGDAKPATVPGAIPGLSGAGAVSGSARPGMISPSPGASSGRTATAAATGAVRPGEVAAPAPIQTAPYQLPPPVLPDP